MEFMNFRQGGMRVKDYSLKFTKLFEYSQTLVENSIARMNKFVMGLSSMVEKECRTIMLHNDMYISILIVYAQKIEESKLREMT